jgi:hypothetical protein
VKERTREVEKNFWNNDLLGSSRRPKDWLSYGITYFHSESPTFAKTPLKPLRLVMHRNVNKSSDEAKIKANVRPCVPKTLCPENDQSDRQDRGLLHDPCDLLIFPHHRPTSASVSLRNVLYYTRYRT